MDKSILILVTQPPTPDCEALEYALAMAAFDISVKLLFTGDGVYWLQQNQAARKTGGKSPSKLLAATGLYGVEDIGYISDSYATADFQSLTQAEASHWINTSHHVVTF